MARAGQHGAAGPGDVSRWGEMSKLVAAVDVLDTLEPLPDAAGVADAVSDDLVIQRVNAGWDHFARSNGGDAAHDEPRPLPRVCRVLLRRRVSVTNVGLRETAAGASGGCSRYPNIAP